MAILEKETNNYYKIEFDECMIKGLSVHVTYSTYKTAEDREKEKVRRPLLSEFLNNMQQRLSKLDTEINAAVEASGLTPSDITDAEGYIREGEFPELRSKQNELILLSPVQQEVFSRFYLYGEQEVTELPCSVSKQVLEGYGFDETWITDPVRFAIKAQIHCGDYNGEEITQEFYYNRLKAQMSENIMDC